MNTLNVFTTYSKWFRVLNTLFIPMAVLELLAVKTNIFSLVASVVSGLYFFLWFSTLVIESIYRIIKSLLKNKH